MLFRKTVSICLSIVLCVCFCITSFASENYDLNEASAPFIISTLPIPQDVDDYAIDIFSRLSLSNFAAMGFDSSEIVDLSLSPGFNMVDAESNNYINNVYHYIIKSGDNFVGSLVVTNTYGEYNFQISKSEYAAELNEVRRNVSRDGNKLFTVVATDDSCYCVDRNATYILDVKDTVSAASLSKSIKLSPVYGGEYIDISDTIYNLNSVTQNSVNDSYILNVPYCSNVVVNGVGTCWISVAASIIDFRLNGAFSSESSANQYRNLILQNAYVIANNYAGTISDICAFINSPTLCSYIVYSGMPLFTITQSLMYMGSPCAIEFLSLSPWSTASHAVVLAGFSCLSSNPHDPAGQACYIMDPNTTGITMIGYSSYYYPWWNNSQGFMWNSTAINSTDMPY